MYVAARKKKQPLQPGIYKIPPEDEEEEDGQFCDHEEEEYGQYCDDEYAEDA